MVSLASSLSCVCVLFSQSLLIFYPGSICADKNQMVCNIDIHCPIGSPQTLSLLMQVTIITTGQQVFMSLQCQAQAKVCFVDISEIITLSTLTTLIFTFFSPIVNFFCSPKAFFFLSECYTFFFSPKAFFFSFRVLHFFFLEIPHSQEDASVQCYWFLKVSQPLTFRGGCA